MYISLAVRTLRFVAILFLLGVLVAIYFYPGGNIHDPYQIGYSITHNFLSDLGGYKAHSGELNLVSSFFFNLSMISFSLIGVAFFFIPQLFKEDLITFILAIVGSIFFVLGTFFFAGVGLTPHDINRELHIFFAVNGFRLLIPGSFFYLLVLIRSPISNQYTIFTIFFLLSVVSYVVYQLIGDNPMESQQAMATAASSQKLITLVCVLSIFSLSYAFSSKLNYLNVR